MNATAACPTDSRFVAFQTQKFFGNLDGLRAISILAVIWHHAAGASMQGGLALLQAGNRGVNLFFVISAFLISTLLIRSKRAGPIDIPRFWCRRALRILPLYYLMLLVYALAVAFGEKDMAARDGFFEHVKWFATFTSNWFVSLDEGERVIFYFAWSLAAEEQFYLCWPWIEKAFAGMRPALIALGALCVTQVVGAVYAAGHKLILLKIVSSVPAAILMGVMLAHIMDTPRGFAAIARIAGHRGSAIVALLITAAALQFENYFGQGTEIIIGLALTWLVATCVVSETNDLSKALQARPLAWIGKISYGIYLMHILCIALVKSRLGVTAASHPGLLFVCSSALSVAVASISYLTYERAFLRIKERSFSAKPAPAPKATNAPSAGLPATSAAPSLVALAANRDAVAAPVSSTAPS